MYKKKDAIILSRKIEPCIKTYIKSNIKKVRKENKISKKYNRFRLINKLKRSTTNTKIHGITRNTKNAYNRKK